MVVEHLGWWAARDPSLEPFWKADPAHYEKYVARLKELGRNPEGMPSRPV